MASTNRQVATFHAAAAGYKTEPKKSLFQNFLNAYYAVQKTKKPKQKLQSFCAKNFKKNKNFRFKI